MSAARADGVEAAVAERELDALLVTDLVNVRWLTGYTGSNGLAVVGPGRRMFATDFRYVSQAEQQVPDFDRRIVDQSLYEPLGVGGKGVLAGALRVGFDDAHVTVKAHAELRERLPGIELVPAAGVIEDLREVKDAEEVERIAAATTLADEALRGVLEQGVAGRTERDLATELELAMRRLGASGPSFPSIVASGPHGALPHAEPRDVAIPAGVLVTIDWGAQLDGYCSDCTRTVASGAVDDEAREVYELVARAQAAALAAVRPGPRGREIDGVAREIIDAAGHADHFRHGLGHGVGLEIHEGPRLSRTAETSLRAGNVVTVEPGVYLPGRCGVRIEDLVVLTETGHTVLTALSKDLTIVG